MSILMKAQTALALGLFNLFRVFKYRLSVKTGLNPVQKLTAKMPEGQFFSTTPECTKEKNFPKTLQAFGYLEYPLTQGIPNWFYSPLTQHEFQNSHLAWYKIPDFDANVGDIKGIWEASRFDWVLNFVLQTQQHNDEALHVLDTWLNDWCQKNSAYLGPNWKCGQEASIRVMHLIAGLIGLNQLTQPSQNIQQLIALHLKRIAPTIDYAIAQNNNHGTSEAIALYIGGSLLNSINPSSLYSNWTNLGLKWLENRAKKLIMEDGGFSQYSVNYHRVMLDSYSLAEIVRQRLNLKEFSSSFYQQLKKATDWLYVLTQENGDAPNLGANDGARLLPVSETDYRDFRPSVQLASTLFTDQSYYKNNDAYDESLIFFKVKKKNLTISNLPNKNQFFNRSGLITAQQADLFLAFKLPIYKFKPSQCDALHLDLWLRGKNILRDGGTFSYNSTNEDFEYFGGVRSHNTIQFDNREQMPRLRRFLLGAWLSPKRLQYFSKNKFSCGYRDYLGAEHFREIFFTENYLEVKDSVQGFKDFAILRWRLNPGQWILNDHKLTDRLVEISIQAEHPITLKLVEGQESRYYYQKTSIPVLEVIISKPTTVTSTIKVLI